MPYALSRKYPAAGREWGWPYVFPAWNVSVDPRSDTERRHHLDEKAVQRAMKEAVRAVDLAKPATLHHSFATHLLQHPYGAGVVRHTRMIYTHVLNRGGRGVVSPLDV